MEKDLFGEELPLNSSTIRKKKRTKNDGITRTLYDYFMLDIFSTLPTVGKEQMPVLEPVDANLELPNEMVAFDEAFTKKRTNCIVHFFTDDRRFLRIFRNPKKYLPFLKECAAVIEPDLSQYINMPYALRQAHAWLNRALAAWLLGCRVKVSILSKISRGRLKTVTHIVLKEGQKTLLSLSIVQELSDTILVNIFGEKDIKTSFLLLILQKFSAMAIECQMRKLT